MMEFGDRRVTLISDEAVSTNGNTTDTYEGRKISGRCTYPGCPENASDDSQLCPSHRDGYRARKRSSQNAIRAERRAAGMCQRCGVNKTDDYMCAACRVKYARTARPKIAGEHNDEHNHADRVSARLIAWENSPQNAGRKRLRGGKRGAPGVDEQDAFERKIVEQGIERYIAGCKWLASPEGKRSPKEDRESARIAALGQLELAVRAADDILDRNRYAEKLERQRARLAKSLHRRTGESLK